MLQELSPEKSWRASSKITCMWCLDSKSYNKGRGLGCREDSRNGEISHSRFLGSIQFKEKLSSGEVKVRNSWMIDGAN